MNGMQLPYANTTSGSRRISKLLDIIRIKEAIFFSPFYV